MSSLHGPSPKTRHGCPHCKREFLRSCLLEAVKKNDKEVKLICTACEKDYRLANTVEQREMVKLKFGKPFATETIFSITQLGVGDIFQLKAFNADCIMVIAEVVQDTEKVRVCKIADVGGQALVCDRWFSVEDLQSRKATLYRFMPLDCLPRPETLRRATDPTLVAKERSSPVKKFNFFGNWCKTGNFERLGQKDFSVFESLGKILKNPMKSYREYKNIGTGLDMPGYDATTAECGWNDTGEGWSSSKVGVGHLHGHSKCEDVADSEKCSPSGRKRKLDLPASDSSKDASLDRPLPREMDLSASDSSKDASLDRPLPRDMDLSAADSSAKDASLDRPSEGKMDLLEDEKQK